MASSTINNKDGERLPIYGHFIDGGDGTFSDDSLDNGPGTKSGSIPLATIRSPATNLPVLRFRKSSPSDVERALTTAHSAFHARDSDSTAWSHPSQTARRASVLSSIGTLLRRNTERLADLEVRQIGRPRREMRFQLSRLPEWFEYYASMLRVREDSVSPFGPGHLNVIKRVPLGVVVQITPWNHPLLIAVKKLIPAVAAGNSVVCKPSEVAPASVVELASLCSEAGLPPGVFNVVLGGREVGERLVNDERVAKVDFTGGPKAGRSIGGAAGSNLCAVTQELGGKAPMIVFGPPGYADGGVQYSREATDSYLDRIVNGCAFGAFIASGQTCIAGTRILIERCVYDRFKEKIVEKVGTFRMGDPESADTTIGPVITAAQVDFIQGCVDQGLAAAEEGRVPALEVLCGGGPYKGFLGKEAPLNSGNYYSPTVIASTDALDDEALLRLHHTNPLFQKELFGPVVLLMPFATERHAVTLANDTPYGLGCSVWTNDLVKAHRVADEVHAGIIWINDHHKNHPSSPWGGLTKESGVGRENGLDAFREYTQSKSIVMNAGRYDDDWFGGGANARYN